jgi:hypothetical protein
VKKNRNAAGRSQERLARQRLLSGVFAEGKAKALLADIERKSALGGDQVRLAALILHVETRL